MHLCLYASEKENRSENIRRTKESSGGEKNDLTPPRGWVQNIRRAAKRGERPIKIPTIGREGEQLRDEQRSGRADLRYRY